MKPIPLTPETAALAAHLVRFEPPEQALANPVPLPKKEGLPSRTAPPLSFQVGFEASAQSQPYVREPF